MISTLRKALVLLALIAALGLPLAAQLTDCAFTFSFTGDANQTGVSNLSGQTPCVNWRITYSVTLTLTSTVTFQTSPDNSTWTSVPNSLCSSAVQPPCVLQGTNPLTGTTQGMALIAAYGAYVRVITSGSAGAGTGTVRGYGSKGATASAASGGSGAGSVTSVGLLGTANQITVTGASPITASGSWTLTLPDPLITPGKVGVNTGVRTGNTTPQAELVTWGGNTVVGDPSVLGSESLTNGALTSGTSWSVTGDFALAANAATYTHSAGSGTLTQAAVDLAVAGVGNRWYKFVYTVSAVTAGVTACSITTAFSDNAFGIAFDIAAGVGKVFYFKSTTTPGAFVISCTSTAGGLTLDDLSLKEVQGGNAIVYGLVTGGGAFGLKVRANGNAEISNNINGGNLTVTSSSNAASIQISASNTGGRNWRLISGSSIAAAAPSGFAIQDTAVGTRVYIDALGQFAIGHTANVAYSLDVSNGVGLSGTIRAFDQTTTTGATLVTITPGASQTADSTVLDVQALARFGGTNTTAAVAGVIGATCPAITCTAAYKWIKAIAADNSVVYFPVWK